MRSYLLRPPPLPSRGSAPISRGEGAWIPHHFLKYYDDVTYVNPGTECTALKELLLVTLAESQSETEILIPLDGTGNGKGPFNSLHCLISSSEKRMRLRTRTDRDTVELLLVEVEGVVMVVADLIEQPAVEEEYEFAVSSASRTR
ncbi:hypothetical protein EJB05_47378, partial [Eragrostis curvula]